MFLIHITTHCFFVKLFFVLFFASTRTSENDFLQVCSSEEFDNLTWPTTTEGTCGRSIPLCINEEYEISERCCSKNRTWDDIPTCKQTQDIDNSFKPCPDNLVLKEDVCIFVINSTNYPPQCPYEETLSSIHYVNRINDDDFPIWVPVTRENGKYGEGLFTWKEYSTRYKLNFDITYNYDDSLEQKNCLIYYNESYYKAVSCNENYTGICVYEALPYRTKTFCSQYYGSDCKQSRYSTKSSCFCKRNESDQNFSKIELLLPYQNLLYYKLNEICLIGLEKRDNSYIWVDSNLPINYTFWSIYTTFNEDYVLGAISSAGWVLKSTEQDQNCVLIEKIPPVNIRGSIKWLITDDTLTAVLENAVYFKQNENDSDPMIFCFTDAYNDSIIHRLTTDTVFVDENVGFQFAKVQNGPANYWCEGFLYPELEVIKSDIYFEESSSAEYVAIITTSYYEENPLTNYFISDMSLNFSKAAQELLPTYFYPRIFKIVEINEFTSEITLNFHITTREDENANLYLYWYTQLLSSLSQLNNFTLKNLFSISFCIGAQINTPGGETQTWPTVNISYTLYKPIEGWCIAEDGTVVTRSCKGNFIDGASTEPLRDCLINNTVDPLLILTYLSGLENPIPYLELVTEIVTNKPDTFIDQHIELIAEILKNTADSNPKSNLNMNIFMELINSVLEINQTVLKESQENFNSTDKILEFIKEIIEESDFVNDITKDWISVVTFSVEDYYSNSIFWKRNETGFSIDYVNLTENNLQPGQLNIDFDFDAGLYFDRELLETVTNNSNSKIIVIAYFKSSLFNEEYFDRHTETIFTAIFPTANILPTTNLDYVLMTMYNNDYDPDLYNCSYWIKDKNTTKGYWQFKSKSEGVNSMLTCKFTRITNVGLVKTTNITEELEELESKGDCSKILCKIIIFLEKFSNQFTSIDVNLSSKLIQRCSDDIHAFDVFDKLIDLPYSVIEDSVLYQNTDLLGTFYKIITHYPITGLSMIQQKNYQTAIIPMEDRNYNNIIGFCKNKNLMTLIYKNTTLESDNEILFLLSDSLINQIQSNSNKIIFTLFVSDIFFIGKKLNSYINLTKAVGFQLSPDIERRLDGNIKVRYKIEDENGVNITCASWKNSYWEPDNPARVVDKNNYECEIWLLGYFRIRYKSFNLTTELEKLLNGDDVNDILGQIEYFTQNFSEMFTSYDLNLIATYLSSLRAADVIILDICSDIISNIMNFDKNLLYNAETQYKSTSKLLHALNIVANYINKSFTICKPNLIVAVALLKDKIVYGINVNNITKVCGYELITDDNKPNIYTGLMLDQEFVTRLSSDPEARIILTVFYQNSLFIDGENGDSFVEHLIFGAEIPNFINYFSKDLAVYNLEQSDCVFWQYENGMFNSTAKWELKSRMDRNEICHYYQKGYYTILLKTRDTDTLSNILQGIYNSTENTERKLEQLESVTSFYDELTASDIYQVVQILQTFADLSLDHIFLLKKIFTNYFHIESNIKTESQIQFFSTKYLLDFISKTELLLTPGDRFAIENYFKIIVCGNTVVTITTNNTYCSNVISKEEEEVDIVLHCTGCTDKLIVKIFKENDLFIDMDNSTTSKIIGVSINQNKKQEDQIFVTLKFTKTQHRIIPICSCWNFISNSNGEWSYFKTIQTKSEIICEIDNIQFCQYIALSFNENNMTTLITNLIKSNISIAELLEIFEYITNFYKNQFTPYDINLFGNYLLEIDYVDIHIMELCTCIISNIIDFDIKILQLAEEFTLSTNKLTFALNKILDQFHASITFCTRNLIVSVSLLKEQEIYGINVKGVHEPCLYELVTNDTEEITTGMILNREFITELKTNNVKKLLITVYYTDHLFVENNNEKKNVGLIFGLQIPGYQEKYLSKDVIVYYNGTTDTYTCVFWQYFNKDSYTNPAIWDLQKPINSDLTCNYYKQGFYTLWQKDYINYNTTKMLEHIHLSNVNIERKLEELESVSAFYKKFSSIDIYYGLQICKQIIELNQNLLTLLHRIGVNYFKVPSNIKQQSQIEYDATESILNFISSEGLKLEISTTIIIEENLKIIICDYDNLVTITKNSVYCSNTNEKEEIYATVNCTNCKDALLVTVFKENDLFVDFQQSTTSKIIGLSSNTEKDIMITLTFSKTGIDQDEYFCGCWEFIPDLNGKWNYFNTIREDSKIICEINNIETCKYVSLHYNFNNITALIKDLIESDINELEILHQFNNITKSYQNQFTPYDLDLIANYLLELNYVDDRILESVTYIISNIMDFNKTLLQLSEELNLTTNKLTFALNKILDQFNTSTKFCTSNLIVIVSLLKEQQFDGVNIKTIETPCEYELITNVNQNFTTGMILNNEFITQINNSDIPIPKIIVTVYYSNSLFVEVNNNNNKDSNISIIFGLQISGYKQKYITKDVIIYYNNKNIVNITGKEGCIYWQYINETIISSANWEIRKQINPDHSCNYFKQGFYSIIQSDNMIYNITEILDDIYKSNDSIERKLEQLESVSTFYNNFSPKDLYLLLKILFDISTFNHDSLLLHRIGANYFNIPSNIKQKSQILYNSTKLLLDYTSQNALKLTPNLPFKIGYLYIITCEIKYINTIIITRNTLECSNNNYYNSQNESDITVNVLLNSIKISVALYDANDLFVDNEKSETTKIIGLYTDSTTNIVKRFADGNTVDTSKINIEFIHKANFSCGYWEFVPNQNGKWIYLSTIRKELTVTCVVKDIERCKHVALIELSVTQILDDLRTAVITFSEKLILLSQVLQDFKSDISPANLDTVYKILENVILVEDTDIVIFTEIVNRLMNINREILAAAQDEFNTTEKLLFCFDNIIKQFKGEINIQHPNFALIVQKNISGLVFGLSDKTYTIRNILNYGDNISADSEETILLIDKFLKGYDSEIYISVYFNDALFNGRYKLLIKHKGIIVGVGIPERGLNSNLRVYFKNFQNQTNICALWNHKPVDNSQTGYWETITTNSCQNRIDVRYLGLLEQYNVTTDLEDVLKSTDTAEQKLDAVINIIENNTQILQPFDIYLISEILRTVSQSCNITRIHVEKTTEIISNLFEVNRTVLQESQYQYRATDSLLFTTDEVMKKCTESLEPIVQPNITVAKVDVSDGNVTSVVLKDCDDSQCSISFLNSKDISDISDDEGFENALVFSDELLQQIEHNSQPVILLITIYFYDNFFNELTNRSMTTSKILGVHLDGLDKELQGKILIVYNIEDIDSYDNTSCAFWKYQVNVNSPLDGFWKDDVIPQSNSTIVHCEYDHITHFVLLLGNVAAEVEELNESHILDMITNVNSVLSLLGITGILLTAVLFDRWRNNTGNQILINFSIAISIKNVMLYISEGVYTEGNKSMACTVTGGILHYSLLAEFCWMLIIAILQFKRFVEVLGGPLKYVLLKACICGWVFPALPVFLIIIIDVNNYSQSDMGLCYPSDFGLYLGVWLPLIVIISINFVIFVFILYNVFHKKTEYRDQVNHEIIFQWRLAILLFSMLGLTWTFGFLALMFKSAICAVLFCVMATLQGFIMFLFFIVFNKNTRYLYVQSFRSWMYTKGYKDRLK